MEMKAIRTLTDALLERADDQINAYQLHGDKEALVSNLEDIRKAAVHASCLCGIVPHTATERYETENALWMLINRIDSVKKEMAGE